MLDGCLRDLKKFITYKRIDDDDNGDVTLAMCRSRPSIDQIIANHGPAKVAECCHILFAQIPYEIAIDKDALLFYHGNLSWALREANAVIERKKHTSVEECKEAIECYIMEKKVIAYPTLEASLKAVYKVKDTFNYDLIVKAIYKLIKEYAEKLQVPEKVTAVEVNNIFNWINNIRNFIDFLPAATNE